MTPKWKIEKHDYDFSDVPKAELEACFLYEFARESRAVRKMVAQIRSLTNPKPGTPHLINVASRTIQNQFLLLMSLAARFPATAWPSLSETDKRPLLELPWRISECIAHLIRIADPSPPLVFHFDPATTTLDAAIQTYRRQFPGASHDPIKFGFIALNLKYKDEALFTEPFTRNLRSLLKGEPHRGWRAVEKPVATKPKPTKSRGRHSFRDPLNGLGAMRLRSCCDAFPEAKTKMRSLHSKTGGMFYSHRRDFNRACETGLRYFRALSDLFGNPLSELPIHHTEGWEK